MAENIIQVAGTALAAGPSSNGQIPVQQQWNAGRTFINFILDRVTGITTEALASMSINSGMPPTTTSGTSYTVPSGKTLRLQGMVVTILDSTTTAVYGRVRVRCATTVAASSPIVIDIDIGNFTGTAAAGVGQTVEINFPDGIEIPASAQIGITHLESSASSTVSVCLVGFYY
jgi:hypothetical protein